MKIAITSIALCILSALSTHAQVRIGAETGYATAFKTANAGAYAEIFITEKIAVSSDILFFLPTTHNQVERNWTEFNINGHYYIYTYKALDFYGIGGINYTNSRYHYKVDNYKKSQNVVNVNVGGGINFRAGEKILPFSELRFVGGEKNINILVGVKFEL